MLNEQGNRMLNKICRWLEGNKLIRVLIPFSGSSLDEASQEQSGSLESHLDNKKMYTCRFCHQSGRDRFQAGPCRVCNGQGTVERSLMNSIDCRHCQGKGVEPYRSQQCKVCGGSGVVQRIIESPQKPKIPITYSDPDVSKGQQKTPLSNNLPKSAKGEQS